MREVLLDGKQMQNKTSLHDYLQAQLAIPGYFGNNLDALWDALSSYHKELHIVLENKTALLESLENYGVAMIKLFEEVAEDNSQITFTVN